jgi:hypothetical protein
MKKTMACLMSVLFIGVMFPTLSFAASVSEQEVADVCLSLSKQFYALADTNPQDKCAVEVAVTGAYIEAAAKSINYGNYQRGLIHLTSAEKSIRTIQVSNKYCTTFSTLLKPFLNDTLRIKSEVEAMQNS